MIQQIKFTELPSQTIGGSSLRVETNAEERSGPTWSETVKNVTPAALPERNRASEVGAGVGG